MFLICRNSGSRDLQSIAVVHAAAVEQPATTAAAATGTALPNQLQLVNMTATAGQPSVSAAEPTAAAAVAGDGGLRQRHSFMSRLSRSSRSQKALKGELYEQEG
jgi:hypothetical protein